MSLSAAAFHGAVRAAFAFVCSALVVACDRPEASHPEAPTATIPARFDAGAARDADVPEAAASPSASRWIVFEGPPYVRQTPMHGGPAWSIDAPELPARIRSSGAIVLPLARGRGLSSVPNLAVRFLSADGARVERVVNLLTEAEFDHALKADEDGKRISFATLGDTVRGRVDALNAELDARGTDIVPFGACVVDPSDPYTNWPPCGAVQSLQCGAVTLRYLGGHQTLETPRGPRTFPAWRKPKVRSGDAHDVVVNECVSGAWLDPEAKVLALHIANLCAVPGDWCSVESDWRFVRLDR